MGPGLAAKRPENAAISLQLRLLEKALAIRRLDPEPGIPSVAQHPHRDFGAGRPGFPDLAVEVGEALDVAVADLGDHVALLQAGLGRRAARRDILETSCLFT